MSSSFLCFVAIFLLAGTSCRGVRPQEAPFASHARLPAYSSNSLLARITETEEPTAESDISGNGARRMLDISLLAAGANLSAAQRGSHNGDHGEPAAKGGHGKHKHKHEHKHDEHDHEHGHDHEPELAEGVMEQENHAGLVAGAMLIVFVVALMSLLFLLDYPDPQVHSYTYKLLSSIISILCALMFEKTQDLLLMKGLIIPIFGFCHGLDELFCFIPFVISFFSIRVLCCWFQNMPNALFAVENIIGHLAAFIAIEMFDEPLHHLSHQFDDPNELVDGRTIWYVAAPMFSIIMFKLLSRASIAFSAKIFKLESDAANNEHTHQGDAGSQCDPASRTHDHGGNSEHHHSWQNCVVNGEGEASAIVFGFLLKQLGETLIEEAYGESEHADEHSRSAVQALFLYTSTLGIVYLVALHLRDRLEDALGEDIYERVEEHLAFTISWCVATTSKWLTYMLVSTPDTHSTLKSITVRKLIYNLWVSPTMVTLVIFMDWLADRGMFDDRKAGGVIACCGLITGIAWEQCFASSVRTISSTFTWSPAVLQTILGFGLVAILVPGWLKFVVPEARLPVPLRDHE